MKSINISTNREAYQKLREKTFMEILKGREVKAYVAAIYGPPGIGKSTLANGADKPFFLNIEDALHHIDCSRSEVITSTASVKYYLSKICGEHANEYNTIVLDTIDSLEDIMIDEICLAHSKQSLAAFGFGKGFDLLNKKWVEILGWFSYAARAYKKNIILVGHDQVKRFEDPLGDGWDRVILKMHHKSALTLVSKVDALFYMTWDKVIRKTENDVRKAIGTGRRIIHTQESPAFIAKNRYELEEKIEGNYTFFSDLQKIAQEHFNEPILERVNDQL